MFQLNDTAHCVEYILDLPAPNPKLSMFWALSMIWLSWSKLSEKVQKWHSNFSRPSVFLSYWLKHAKYCLYIISNTLQIILVWKGGVWGGCAPSEAMKTLQFSNLICAIWCILFGNIPKRRKDHHLDDSLFSDNLNRIDIKVQLW